MPTSNIDPIPLIIKTVNNVKPDSILDIGCGFGKYGYLFRELLDICEDQKKVFDNYSIDRRNWRHKIDAVEIFDKYICELQRYIYSNIFIGNISDLIGKLDHYDVILMADVIEHFKKKDGLKLLDKLFDKTNKLLIITTPPFDYQQGEFLGNKFERHESSWKAIDFKKFENKAIVNVNNNSLCIFLSKSEKKFKAPVLIERVSVNEKVKLFIYNSFGNNAGDYFVNLTRKIKTKKLLRV